MALVILLCFNVALVGSLIITALDNDKAVVVTGIIAVLLILGLLATPLSGWMPDYSSGERQGYINKLSLRGAIWKTWEGEMQIGAGAQAALQEPWRFSVRDEALVEPIRACIGQRSSVEYREWLVGKLPEMGTDYEIVAIECGGAE